MTYVVVKKGRILGYASRIAKSYKLKQLIYTLYRDLESFDGTKERLKEQFYKSIKEVQKKLGDNCFDLLIKSMKYPVNAVLKAIDSKENIYYYHFYVIHLSHN